MELAEDTVQKTAGVQQTLGFCRIKIECIYIKFYALRGIRWNRRFTLFTVLDVCDLPRLQQPMRVVMIY